MNLLIVISIFSAPLLFGYIAVKSSQAISNRAEKFARKAGMKSTQDFFSEVERTYARAPARVLRTQKRHIEHARSGFGELVKHEYYADIFVEYRIGGKRHTCSKSLFNMVPSGQEYLADKAINLAVHSSHIRVYYQPDNLQDAYIIIDGVKSWKVLNKRAAQEEN